MVTKIKPHADIVFNSGNDGRDCFYEVRYTCPSCRKIIREDDIACDKCGTFFDWSEKAHIKIERTIEWR